MNTDAQLASQRLTVDRLGWLLLSLALVLAPHVTRLPLWVTALFAAMAMWRLGAARMRWGMAPAWLRAGMAIAGLVAVGVQFRAWGGQEAGTAMLVVMMSLKLTEAVRKRDGLVLVFVGYILVIANFLYSQTLPTLAYMIAVTWMITATLLHLTHPTSGVPLRPRFRLAGVLLLQALPLAVVLFVLFPRVPGPLWGVPAGQTATSGLTDSMEPGSIAQLSLSAEVAFRVTFDEEAPPSRERYWRGPVLRNFDGRTWTQGDPVPTGGFRFEAANRPVRYEVVIEPHRHRWLFALDLPGEIPEDTEASRTFQLLADGPVRQRRRYSLTSYTAYRTGPEESQLELQLAQRLPSAGNPRARRWADELRATHDDPRELVDTVLLHFNTEQYHYTLSPPGLGANAVDEFLFDTRRGFCEHYAGSFTFLMRAAGIPARVVLGYQGGELNPVGDYLIVRQSDAHAWVEIHLDDTGWVRVDPTAAVSPDRIELGIDAIEGLEGRPLEGLRSMPWVNQLRLRWDDLNNRWNLFVLTYDRETQEALLARFGIEDGGYRTLVLLLVVSVSAILAALAAWLLWQVRPTRDRDRAVRLYRRLQRRLVERGLPARRPDEGPEDYAARVIAADPGLAAPVTAFIEAYVQFRYRPAASEADLTRMNAALRQLRQAR
jgi:protein-glutamine gamma-glutamyltransferase